MTILVGVSPDGSSTGSLNLATLLARSAQQPIALVTVMPTPWVPGVGRVDSEYHQQLDQVGADALELARAGFPDDLEVTIATRRARSAPAGLLEAVDELGARLVVLGSSTAGVIGRISLGSVTDRLVHSSPVPLALAPRGFRIPVGEKVHRVTAAYGGSDEADDLIVAAAGVTADVGATLRIATFAVWPLPPYTAGVGGRDPAVEHWEAGMREHAAAAAEDARSLPRPPSEVTAVVGHGHTWPEAIDDLDWTPSDVLVVGSSSLGRASQVFLGSRATKIMRHSPVPVVVVPRGAAVELAERAETS